MPRRCWWVLSLALMLVSASPGRGEDPFVCPPAPRGMRPDGRAGAMQIEPSGVHRATCGYRFEDEPGTANPVFSLTVSWAQGRAPVGESDVFWKDCKSPLDPAIALTNSPTHWVRVELPKFDAAHPKVAEAKAAIDPDRLALEMLGEAADRALPCVYAPPPPPPQPGGPPTATGKESAPALPEPVRSRCPGDHEPLLVQTLGASSRAAGGVLETIPGGYRIRASEKGPIELCLSTRPVQDLELTARVRLLNKPGDPKRLIAFATSVSESLSVGTPDVSLIRSDTRIEALAYPSVSGATSSKRPEKIGLLRLVYGFESHPVVQMGVFRDRRGYRLQADDAEVQTAEVAYGQPVWVLLHIDPGTTVEITDLVLCGGPKGGTR